MKHIKNYKNIFLFYKKILKIFPKHVPELLFNNYY